LVNQALPLATQIEVIRLVFGILKQIQIGVLNEFNQISFWLKLFELFYLDLFIGKYFIIK